jgi:hypothetical protein
MIPFPAVLNLRRLDSINGLDDTVIKALVSLLVDKKEIRSRGGL